GAAAGATVISLGDGATLQYTGSTAAIAATGAASHTYTLLGGASTIDVNTSGQALTLNGVIGQASGAIGSLTKIGAGTLVLGGVNSYTGAITVNVGILKTGVANAIANTSAVTVAAPASFDLNGSNQSVGSIAGAGTV